MGLTDERTEPFKFVFAPGTMIDPKQYLVLYADNDSTPPGIHLGFQLDSDGDDLSLYSPAGALIDSIRFGVQVSDLSIGRLTDGSWGLTRPSFGSANIAQPTGDQTALRINEWLADARNVCGLSPTLSFLESTRPDTGKLLHYDQYVHPLGQESVSFASMAFYGKAK